MKIFHVHPALQKRSRRIVLGDPKSNQQIYLGRLAEFGPLKDIYLDISGEHVVAIVGKRGSGKTHTLGVL